MRENERKKIRTISNSAIIIKFCKFRPGSEENKRQELTLLHPSQDHAKCHGVKESTSQYGVHRFMTVQ